MIIRGGLAVAVALVLAIQMLSAAPALSHPTDCMESMDKRCPPAQAAGLAARVLQAPSLAAPAGGTDEPMIPCTDERGCPDLWVDAEMMREGEIEERFFPASSCSVIEGHTEPGQRRLLRFTFTTPNEGPGDLIVGAPAEHPEWFEYSPCHRHHHFREYADYRLWTPPGYAAWTALRATMPGATAEEVLEAYPVLETGFVGGHKQGFCVIDIRNYEPGAPSNYHSCVSDQGISVGWADEYHWRLDGQWVDITDVVPGVYVLEAEVNAEHFYEEADYANNAAAIEVLVPAP